ncbi:hypothetical protein AAGC94_04785 [Clostridium sporogenes]|uniref:hypothetical protein n=1 Tax=Clostridium sporogenes TaxID=1509 RepID=UPI00313DE69B
MNKKTVIYPLLSIFLLAPIIIGGMLEINPPISSSNSYVLFIIISLAIILFSFIGIIINIKIPKESRTTINIILSIVCIIILVFTALWLLIILSFESYNSDSILYKIFRKP